MEQRKDPYSFRRMPNKKTRAEDDAGKMRDGYMVPAELRGRALSPEEVAAAVNHKPAKPPGKS
jgi:hypothetical protein